MLNKFWNNNILGIPGLLFLILRGAYLKFLDNCCTLIWRNNIKVAGKNFNCQKGLRMNFPGNLKVGDNVSIGRDVTVFTEFPNSHFIINSNSMINTRTQIDYSGGLVIGENVVISEDSVILTHDHGHNPKSHPKKIEKKIEDNVWIGQYSLILPQVKFIGKNSIIGTGAVVTKDVPSNVIVVGNPAKIINYLNND